MNTMSIENWHRRRFPALDENGGLACPACGCDNLHHSAVRVFSRGEDAEEVQVVEIEGYESEVKVTHRMNENSGNPSSRRHGLIVQFYCEQCPVLSSLAIQQHKGTTYVEWVDRIA